MLPMLFLLTLVSLTAPTYSLSKNDHLAVFQQLLWASFWQILWHLFQSTSHVVFAPQSHMSSGSADD
jgi:hypothetical protein